ncbi:diacylglycerol kinase [Alicyclobacillus sp. SO9]|uniref:diacylglycerol kinase n=1 Tax=Alicyclobacillus sp. SO9 TaxID=2665646 RepID=UPI0018E7CA5F|nr:diacylglycerol kinase [Alicyclobacillus sp. SO9]QQE77332.1 diacylglycerol kinase [Alicyclobacillus sp. SO9]
MSRTHSTWPQAAHFALAGIWGTVCHERNMRIHLWMLTVVSILEIVLRPTLSTVVMVIGASSFVIAAEVMNTAIENAVDLMIGQQYHPLAKAAKDAAAGATLVASFAAVMVGILFLVQMWPWQFRMLSLRHLGGALINVVIACTTLTTIVLSERQYREYRKYGIDGDKSKGGNLGE